MSRTGPPGLGPGGMRLEPVAKCPICDNAGEPRYVGLRDHLFGVPGLWNLDSCRNPQCGSLWLNPRPTEEDIGAAYGDYYTHTSDLPDGRGRLVGRIFRSVHGAVQASYLARRYGYSFHDGSGGARWGRLIDLHPGWRADADFRVMYLPSLPQGTLLDVGCGDGGFIRSMQAFGWETKGIDTDPGAVRRAKENGTNVVLAAPRDLRDDAQYDAVTLSHVIEHVHDPTSFVKECARLLRPGGSLVIVTPNADSAGHRLFTRHWRGLEPPRHLCIFTISALRDLLVRCELTPTRVASTVRGAHELLIASRRLQRGAATLYETPPDVVETWCARGVQLAERLASRFKPALGEEIIAIARKT